MKIPDHYVRVVALPPTVRGVTVPNEDGTFSVYINSLFDDEAQRGALEHELEHLARDHFYSDAPVAAQEAEASGRAPEQAGSPPPPRERMIPLYASLKDLEEYLRRIGALDKPLEDLGRPVW